MKILNLYAGIGGNRKNWDGDKHDITAVEINEEIANVYQDFFPKDNVVVADAHKYLKSNYERFDFIWASPPCPSHSKIRRSGAKKGQYAPVYPDMKLYQEIIFLQSYFEGSYCVENVVAYYDALIEPQKLGRHWYWANFPMPGIEEPPSNIHKGNIEEWQELLGFDLSPYSFETVEKRQVLRNCVHPKIGEAILKSRNKKQTKLPIE